MLINAICMSSQQMWKYKQSFCLFCLFRCQDLLRYIYNLILLYKYVRHMRKFVIVL